MDTESNRAEIEAWLILLRAPGFGVSALRDAIARHGSARQALDEALRGDAPIDASGRDALRMPDRARIADDIAWLDGDTHQLVTIDHADYPALLRDTPGAPVALFIAGDTSALWQPQIAIVGSRTASHAGLANARTFARALAAAGFAITSGLAEGIDAAAHTAALEAGATTVAVLGTGPDLVYPARHRELASCIAASGALVSEFAPGTPGRPENFPRRNRIIAGLALGTLIVEAGLRSGSLITARAAIDQGRDVFAIPGSIHNPLARGCHRLIRDGAALTEGADEIIAALSPLATRLGGHIRERLEAAGPLPDSGKRTVHDGDYAKVLAALGHESIGVDALAERTGLEVPALSSMLLMLELEGEVASERGGRYVRRAQE
jgi:DNA processing protein